MHTTQRPFVLRAPLAAGDLIMWRIAACCWVVANYDTKRDRRVLHRSVVEGTVPF